MGQNYKILPALRDGFLFLSRNFAYLGKLMLLPMVVNMACTLFVQLQIGNTSVIESFLWQSPASLISGWLVFAQTRLVFMGERINTVPDNEWVRNNRNRCMQISVIIFMLFNMFYVLGAEVLFTIVKSSYEYRGGVALFIITLMFWAVRYMFLYIFAAVDYPMKGFIKRGRSVMLSVDIVATLSVVVVPLSLILQTLISILVPDFKDAKDAADQAVGDNVTVAFAVFGSLFSVVSNLVLNAVIACAAKQMIFQKQG